MFLGDLWQNLSSDLCPGAAVLLLFAFRLPHPPQRPPPAFPSSVMSNTLLRYRGGVLPYSDMSLNKSHLPVQSAQSDLGFNKGSEGQSAGKIL